MRHLPYTTKSGLQIGCRYDPPMVNHISAEGQFWQGVFLGYKPVSTSTKIALFTLYCALVTAVFVAVALFVR